MVFVVSFVMQLGVPFIAMYFFSLACRCLLFILGVMYRVRHISFFLSLFSQVVISLCVSLFRYLVSYVCISIVSYFSLFLFPYVFILSLVVSLVSSLVRHCVRQFVRYSFRQFVIQLGVRPLFLFIQCVCQFVFASVVCMYVLSSLVSLCLSFVMYFFIQQVMFVFSQLFTSFVRSFCLYVFRYFFISLFHQFARSLFSSVVFSLVQVFSVMFGSFSLCYLLQVRGLFLALGYVFVSSGLLCLCLQVVMSQLFDLFMCISVCRYVLHSLVLSLVTVYVFMCVGICLVLQFCRSLFLYGLVCRYVCLLLLQSCVIHLFIQFGISLFMSCYCRFHACSVSVFLSVGSQFCLYFRCPDLFLPVWRSLFIYFVRSLLTRYVLVFSNSAWVYFLSAFICLCRQLLALVTMLIVYVCLLFVLGLS